MEQEMRIAAEIQQALLPKGGRVGPFFRAAAASLPCRSIGGDFFDYVDLPDGAFGFALGDVAGKGPPAALLHVRSPAGLAPRAATPGSVLAADHTAVEALTCSFQGRFDFTVAVGPLSAT